MAIAFLTCAAAAFLTCADAQGADDMVIPQTVCEVVSDLAAHEGKIIAIIGRYSFRANGRWMGEEKCPSAGPAPSLWMVEDPKDGPTPPEHLNLDRSALKSKFALVQHRSALQNFRFGTSDYDRWAVVYGRVEKRPAELAANDPAHKASANLVFRGSSVIIVITPGEW